MISVLTRKYNCLYANQKKFLQLFLQGNRNNYLTPARFFANKQEYLIPDKPQKTQILNTSNNIANFYKDSNIFITGTTGFLGKVLLEKLLRSCNGIEKIYVLIREKKGLNADQRLKILLESPVFDLLRKNNPEYFKKVRAIYGDVAQPNLGLRETDKKLIENEINIVFHAAATVRMSEDLQTALELNTFGTIQMMEICKNMKNLKSLVHVSTAYTNAHKKNIEEKVYEAPYNPTYLINCLKNLPPKSIKIIEKDILGEYSNTYIFSKALAENVILEYSKILPATIVRPSIIQSAWKEPFPGWVEITSGGCPIIMLAIRGLLKCIFFNENVAADIVPVDIVANTLISAAWDSSINRSKTIKVYNCTSGQINPITWTTLMNQIKKYAREYPTSKIIFYPSFFYTTNKIVEKTMHIFFHYIPAVIIDLYLYVNKQKPIVRKMTQEVFKLLNDGKMAIRIPLNLHVNTFKSLMESVKNTEDGKSFDIDIRKENGLDWKTQNKIYVLGIRKYIFKDDISNLNQARTKLKRIYWITKTVQLMSVTTFISFVIFYVKK